MGRPRKTCGGELRFECVQGILIHRDGVYRSRCPSCGRDSKHRKMPTLGAKCRAQAVPR